jgi:hypothetical protein
LRRSSKVGSAGQTIRRAPATGRFCASTTNPAIEAPRRSVSATLLEAGSGAATSQRAWT